MDIHEIEKKAKEKAQKDFDTSQLTLGTKKLLPIMLVFDHKIGGAADLMPFIKKLDEIFAAPEILHNW